MRWLCRLLGHKMVGGFPVGAFCWRCEYRPKRRCADG